MRFICPTCAGHARILDCRANDFLGRKDYPEVGIKVQCPDCGGVGLKEYTVMEPKPIKRKPGARVNQYDWRKRVYPQRKQSVHRTAQDGDRADLMTVAKTVNRLPASAAQARGRGLDRRTE